MLKRASFPSFQVLFQTSPTPLIVEAGAEAELAGGRCGRRRNTPARAGLLEGRGRALHSTSRLAEADFLLPFSLPSWSLLRLTLSPHVSDEWVLSYPLRSSLAQVPQDGALQHRGRASSPGMEAELTRYGAGAVHIPGRSVPGTQSWRTSRSFELARFWSFFWSFVPPPQ